MAQSLESRLVRYWLDKRGVSASELARRFVPSITHSAVLQWKSGATSPKDIGAVAKAFGLTIVGFYAAERDLPPDDGTPETGSAEPSSSATSTPDRAA